MSPYRVRVARRTRCARGLPGIRRGGYVIQETHARRVEKRGDLDVLASWRRLEIRRFRDGEVQDSRAHDRSDSSRSGNTSDARESCDFRSLPEPWVSG